MYTRIIFRISLSKHVFAMVIHVSFAKVLMLLKTVSVKMVFSVSSAVIARDHLYRVPAPLLLVLERT